jgi:hypothetical protein
LVKLNDVESGITGELFEKAGGGRFGISVSEKISTGGYSEFLNRGKSRWIVSPVTKY